MGRIKNATAELSIASASCDSGIKAVGGFASSSSHRYDGIFVAFIDSADFNDCYVTNGDSWIIGDNSSGAEGVTELSDRNITTADLSENYSNWIDSERGYPTPYVIIESNHVSSEIGIWIVLGILGAMIPGMGIYNYIRMSLKKGNK